MQAKTELVHPTPVRSSFSCMDFRAFLYFSSPLPTELLNRILSDTSVQPRIGALREVHIFIDNSQNKYH